MDNADRASILLEHELEHELELIIAAARDGVVCGDEEPLCVCVECGHDIEPVRQAYRFTRCLDCALDLDQRARLRA